MKADFSGVFFTALQIIFIIVNPINEKKLHLSVILGFNKTLNYKP